MHEATSLSLCDRCSPNKAFPSMIRSSMTAKVAGRMSRRSPLKDSSPMTDTSPLVWRYQPDWPVDVLGILTIAVYGSWYYGFGVLIDDIGAGLGAGSAALGLAFGLAQVLLGALSCNRAAPRSIRPAAPPRCHWTNRSNFGGLQWTLSRGMAICSSFRRWRRGVGGCRLLWHDPSNVGEDGSCCINAANHSPHHLGSVCVSDCHSGNRISSWHVWLAGCH